MGDHKDNYNSITEFLNKFKSFVTEVCVVIFRRDSFVNLQCIASFYECLEKSRHSYLGTRVVKAFWYTLISKGSCELLSPSTLE